MTRRYAARVVDVMGEMVTFGEGGFVGRCGVLGSANGRDSDGISLAKHAPSKETRAKQSRHGIRYVYAKAEEDNLANM